MTRGTTGSGSGVGSTGTRREGRWSRCLYR